MEAYVNVSIRCRQDIRSIASADSKPDPRQGSPGHFVFNFYGKGRLASRTETISFSAFRMRAPEMNTEAVG